MKNLKIYKGILIITLGSIILTTGCGKVNSVKIENTKDKQSNILVESSKISEATKKTIENTMTQEDIDKVKIEVVVPSESESTNASQSNDEVITKYFEDEKKSLKDIKNLNEFKEKSIKLFITMTDFIFYDSEIYGIKYSDLKEETKKTILNDFAELDSIISSKYPGYKEDVLSRYDKAKDWTIDIFNGTINKIKNGLSDQTLNSIDNTKENLKVTADSIKDTTVNVYKDQKVKVKSWYENFRNKH